MGGKRVVQAAADRIGLDRRELALTPLSQLDRDGEYA